MTHIPSLRILVIALITFAFAAVTISAYWGDGSIFAAKSSLPSAKVMTTPLNAITSFDAAVIARHIANTNPFANVNQFCAADVTNNGAIASNDAARRSRYVTALVRYALTGTICAPHCPS